MVFYARMKSLVQATATLKRCRENLLLEVDCPVEPEKEALACQLLTKENPSAVLK